MTSRPKAQIQGCTGAGPGLRRRGSGNGRTEVARPAKGVEAIDFENTLVLSNPDRQALFLLNDTARIVWDTMNAGVSAKDVAVLLAKGYGLPLATARADVAGFLRQWRAEGLVAAGPAAAQGSSPKDTGPRRHSAPRLRRDFRIEHVYAFRDATFCLRFEDADLGSWMHQLLAHCEAPGADPSHVLEVVCCGTDYVLLRDGLEIRRHSSAQAAAGSVIGVLCDLSHPGADWLLFMHAAAVASRGRAVVMVGPNGSGKSTLAAALVGSGLDYLADDVVPLDGRTMQIMPVPLAISVKEGSWPALATLYPALRTLPVHRSGGRRLRHLAPPRGDHAEPGGAVAKALVFPCFQPDRPTALKRLSPLDVLIRLIDARSSIALDRERLCRTLAWIRTVPSYEMHHRDLQQANAAIMALLEDRNVCPARHVSISASGTDLECEPLQNAVNNEGPERWPERTA